MNNLDKLDIRQLLALRETVKNDQLKLVIDYYVQLRQDAQISDNESSLEKMKRDLDALKYLLEETRAISAKDVTKLSKKTDNTLERLQKQVNDFLLGIQQPQDGKDYMLTNEDYRFLIESVLAELPEVKDGYTPIKGVDYFDGKDGADAEITQEIKDEIAMSVESQLSPVVKQETEGEVLARKLSSIEDPEKRLSYKALKDTPTIPRQGNFGGAARISNEDRARLYGELGVIITRDVNDSITSLTYSNTDAVSVNRTDGVITSLDILRGNSRFTKTINRTGDLISSITIN